MLALLNNTHTREDQRKREERKQGFVPAWSTTKVEIFFVDFKIKKKNISTIQTKNHMGKKVMLGVYFTFLDFPMVEFTI